MDLWQTKGLALPPKLHLSQWIEANLQLPEEVSALPGRVALWPYQREIADEISNPLIERVTLVKPVRVGFTTLLSGTISSFVVNEPAPILVLLPTESDCRRYMVSDIEPIFDATPVLRGALTDADDEGRNTLLRRRFAGGALTVIPARAPRNLRSHTARILLVDEADAMEVTAEGDPINLGEKRTLTFANRKIIIGSTPTFSDTSAVLRHYARSDKRVYEVPCPECGAFTEIMWSHIVWPEDKPEEAAFECPHCKVRVPERYKLRMVKDGQWRATAPDVKGHAGFRLNALVSLVPNATWALLAKEFLEAKDDPAFLQTFVNTILGQGWSSPSMVNEGELEARAQPWGLEDIPAEVLVMTAGGDVQDDRVEVTICGWNRGGDCLILGHVIVWGSFADESTWDEVDTLLRTTWKHPLGGRLKIDAAAIDAGDGEHYQSVLNFCIPKIGRRIFAGKGVGGSQPVWRMAKGKTVEGRLALIGVDTIKNLIFEKFARARGIRFSNTLEASYYEQLAAERRVVKYSRGMPIRRFERVSSRARAEALDALVYATAVRTAVAVSLDRREAEVRMKAPAPVSVASQLAGSRRK